MFPEVIFGRRQSVGKPLSSSVDFFDIINYPFMSLDALMAYNSPAEEDTDSRISDSDSLSSTQDLAALQILLQQARDNIRAAIQHRINHAENDRLPDVLCWKGIEYEMVLPSILNLTIVC